MDPSTNRPESQEGTQDNAPLSNIEEIKNDEIKSDSPDSSEEKKSAIEETPAQQHTYGILEQVLEEPPPPSDKKRYKHHMLFDILMTLGLLIAAAGFTIGMMRMHVMHMAKQSITRHNYRAAIDILKNSPLPELFDGSETDMDNLLNKALYLDAMEKLDANPEDQAALAQLGKIKPDSRFFHLAQEILDKNTVPSDLKLQGSTSHYASPTEQLEEKKHIVDEIKEERSAEK